LSDNLTSSRSPSAGRRPLLRAAGAGLAAAVVSGVLVAVPARLLMRLVALAAGEQTQFSWGGSVGIAAVFVLAMLPGAALAGVTQRYGRWLLVGGAVFLLVPATGVASTELGNSDGFSASTWAQVVPAGAGVYGCLALLPFICLALVGRWSTGPSASSPAGRSPATSPTRTDA